RSSPAGTYAPSLVFAACAPGRDDAAISPDGTTTSTTTAAASGRRPTAPRTPAAEGRSPGTSKGSEAASRQNAGSAGSTAGQSVAAWASTVGSLPRKSTKASSQEPTNTALAGDMRTSATNPAAAVHWRRRRLQKSSRTQV